MNQYNVERYRTLLSIKDDSQKINLLGGRIMRFEDFVYPDLAVMKQSTIVAIHMLQRVIGCHKTSFNVLWGKSYVELRAIQNDLIPQYNEVVK